ncbi:unnamed protein product [Psylliodes chrysocephalus]|uniref:Major facilitator superfamily (MFS) profile domain-containing protein n=1 Tax=Psylliodes chrysocephalus TaxID=3402493 RepID=A0A9P0GH10_9CUCU|nr:unnamed protein product [Psylliodes chrysocephala]
MAVLIKSTSKETEKCWPQVLAIIIGALAGLTNGLLFSWASPFLMKIVNDDEHYDITEEEASYFNIIQPLSLMVASPIFAKLSDVIGRKKTLLLIVIPQIASWLLAGFAKSVYVFYAARICSGIADGCLFATLPTYIGEIANPSVRGTWGNAIPTSLYLGEFLITVIGSYFGVTPTTFICLPLTVLYFIMFMMMPESPYFCIMKGEEENAKSSLRFLKRLRNVDEIYIRLKGDVERQLSESGTWRDLIKIESNRKALIAGLFLRLSQQLSGSSIFLTYTQFIFHKSGAEISHELGSMIYMALCVVLNVSATIFIVPKFGRKICYMSSTALCSLVFLMMGIYMFMDDKLEVDVRTFSYIPVAGMIMFQVFGCFGIGVIPTLMLSELYSASIKSKAMAILVIAFGVGNFVTSIIFYYLNTIFGFYSPFLFFALCAAVSAVLSHYIIPETRGKSLEEIQQMLKNNNKE